MAKLTSLREQLQFNKEIAGIINVLKGVAASEFARLQRERKKFGEYDEYLKKFFQIVQLNGFSHVFIEESKLPSNIVFITSDSGLLGKMNVEIIVTVFEEYKEGDFLTVVGKQGERYVSERTASYHAFPGITDYIYPDEIEKLKNYIVKQVKDKKAGRTIIIYPHFVSFAIQEIQTFHLFPCKLFSKKTETTKSEKDEEERLIVEPSFERIMEYLIEIWITYVVHSIFWESKLSEWAARVLHLEGSSDEVKRQAKTARLDYFRAVHQESDKNIREIFSSSMVLGHKG